MAKNDKNMNFKADEDFKKLTDRLCLDLGCSFGQLARVSILLASDQIKRHPLLLKIIDTVQRDD
jgi:hypothetical protein